MKFLTTLLLLLLIAAAAFAWLFYPPFGPSTETFVDIATGTSGTAIEQQPA